MPTLAFTRLRDFISTAMQIVNRLTKLGLTRIW